MTLTSQDTDTSTASNGHGRGHGDGHGPPAGKSSITAGLGAKFGFRNIGAIYVLLVIIAGFGWWMPTTFLNATTAQQVVNSSAITALAALAIVVPLATSTFDLSIGFTMSLAGVTAAYFAARTDLPVVVAMLLGVGAGLLVGILNGVIVVGMKVDSFIATLASGSVIMAFITMVTDQNPITDVRLAGGFASFAQKDFAGFALPVFYALAVAVALWFLLQKTVPGRQMYAAGFNRDAARLAGISVDRLRFISLMISGTVAGFAGIVLASTISSGSPGAGESYLLPAYAAAFVGATQFQKGRFNSWGTVVAVLLLGTGTTGLALAQAPPWAADLFTGLVLIAALAVTGMERRASGRGTSRIGMLLRRKDRTTADQPAS